MSLRNWWSRLAPGRTPSRSKRRAARPGPRLEALEDRTVPAVTLVSKNALATGAGGDASLTAGIGTGSVSDDGRYIVYLSKATDLVTNQTDSNGKNDVFLFDKVTGTNTLVSRVNGTSATAGDGESFVPFVSGDGNWVAFFSNSTNLISGVTVPFDTHQLYLYDRVGGGLTLVTRDADNPNSGIVNDDIPQAGQLALSDNGEYVAYINDTYDLVAGYTTSETFWTGAGFLPVDAYVYNRTTGTNALVSHVDGNATRGANDFTTLVNISGDGGTVVFTSWATNTVAGQSDAVSTLDIFRYNVGNGTVSLVTHAPGSPTTAAGENDDQDLFPATVSHNGQYIAYASRAMGLVTGQSDTADTYDAFLYNASAQTTALVSHASGSNTTAAGTLYTLLSGNRPVVSANGEYVAFVSSGSTLVSGVSGTNVYLYTASGGAVSLVSHAAGSSTAVTGTNPSISDNGQYVAYISTTSAADVYKYNRTDDSVTLVSHTTASATTPSGGGNATPIISADGTTITWPSTASTLVANDANGKSDVFVTGDAGPELVLSATPIYEGEETTLTGTITGGDPDAVYTVTVDWGNGTETFQNVPVGEFSYTRRYYDDDPTATPQDNQPISVTATSATDELNGSTTVLIRNVDPTLSGVSVTGTYENGTVTLTGTITDPGTKDTFTLTVTWGDGKQDQYSLPAGTDTFSYDHQYYDDDPTATPQDDYTVTVTVEDDDTGVGTATVYATVTNVAPELTGVTVTGVSEDGTVTLTGSFTDPGTKDTHDLTVTWGDGQTSTLSFVPGEPRDFSLTHRYLDDPSGTTEDKYAVTLTLEDDDTGSDTETVYATVSNVAPVLTGVTVTHTDENGTVTLTGSFTDPGTQDSHTLTVTWGDGQTSTQTYNPGDPRTFSLTHQYLDDNPTGTPQDDYPVVVTVADDDGGTGTETVYATVSNVAPVLTGVSVTPAADEGGVVTLTGTFTDPGTLDVHQLTVTWGDGQTEVVTLTVGARDFTVTHTYLDDDPTATPQDDYGIGVTLTDDDGGTASGQTVTTVRNVAPVLAGVTVTPVDEGGVATLTGTFTDPGTQDTHTLTVTWGDGQTEVVTLTAGARDFSVTHTYADDDPTGTPQDNYPVTVTLSDDDGGTGTVGLTALVRNVAPILAGVTVTPVDEGGLATLTGTFTDPGTGDTHELTVTWGDGETSVVTLTSGARDFSVTHTYADDDPTGTPQDNYPVTVTLSDDDGGTGTVGLTALVRNVAPILTGVTMTNLQSNGSAVLRGSFTDPGTPDVHTLTVTWGDGQTEVVNLTVGVRTFEVPHTYPPPTGKNPSAYDVQLSLRDDDSGAATIVVRTTNTNRPPVLTVPPVVTVPENTTPVTTVSATDPDGDPVTYMVNGPDAARFTINPTTGVLAFVSPPNFESPGDANRDNTYQVSVIARDSRGAIASRPVSVVVGDANDVPVIVGGGTVTVNQGENSLPVVRVIATDEDAGQTLTYEVTGPDAGLFTINPVTGRLAFVTAPDFENPGDANRDNVYEVTIAVSDGFGGVAYQTILVTITDRADTNHPPVITSDGGGDDAHIYRTDTTTEVTRVTATDPDRDSLTYLVVGGADAALFTIDPLTGALAFRAQPNARVPGDADADNAYEVTVGVSDGRGGTDTQAITLVVTDGNGVEEVVVARDMVRPWLMQTVTAAFESATGLADAVANGRVRLVKYVARAVSTRFPTGEQEVAVNSPRPTLTTNGNVLTLDYGRGFQTGGRVTDYAIQADLDGDGVYEVGYRFGALTTV